MKLSSLFAHDPSKKMLAPYELAILVGTVFLVCLMISAVTSAHAQKSGKSGDCDGVPVQLTPSQDFAPAVAQQDEGTTTKIEGQGGIEQLRWDIVKIPVPSRMIT